MRVVLDDVEGISGLLDELVLLQAVQLFLNLILNIGIRSQLLDVLGYTNGRETIKITY